MFITFILSHSFPIFLSYTLFFYLSVSLFLVIYLSLSLSSFLSIQLYLLQQLFFYVVLICSCKPLIGFFYWLPWSWVVLEDYNIVCTDQYFLINLLLKESSDWTFGLEVKRDIRSFFTMFIRKVKFFNFFYNFVRGLVILIHKLYLKPNLLKDNQVLLYSKKKWNPINFLSITNLNICELQEKK